MTLRERAELPERPEGERGWVVTSSTIRARSRRVWPFSDLVLELRPSRLVARRGDHRLSKITVVASTTFAGFPLKTLGS